MLEAAEKGGGPYRDLCEDHSNSTLSSCPLCPQVVGSMPTAGSAGSVPENLNLFPEPGSKSEETGKKQLSKDSILSLYGSQTPQMPAQGRFHGDGSIVSDRNMRTYMQELFVVMGAVALGARTLFSKQA